MGSTYYTARHWKAVEWLLQHIEDRNEHGRVIHNPRAIKLPKRGCYKLATAC